MKDESRRSDEVNLAEDLMEVFIIPSKGGIIGTEIAIDAEAHSGEIELGVRN